MAFLGLEVKCFIDTPNSGPGELYKPLSVYTVFLIYRLFLFLRYEDELDTFIIG